jgi:hypothetical protein
VGTKRGNGEDRRCVIVGGRRNSWWSTRRRSTATFTGVDLLLLGVYLAHGGGIVVIDEWEWECDDRNGRCC